MGGRKGVYLKVHEDHHGYSACGRKGRTTKIQAEITCAKCLDSRSARRLARKGICKDCKTPAVPGRTQCERHLAKHRLKSQQARDRAKEAKRNEDAALQQMKERWL